MSECATKLLLKQRKPQLNDPVLCDVCEEPASGNLHYGGMTCESCKAFFLRSVRRNLHTKYKCRWDKNCTLVHESRRRCSACRYAKCRSIGMEPKWVLSAETFQEKQLVLLKKCRMVVLSDDEMKKVLSAVQSYIDLTEAIDPTEIERDFVRRVGNRLPRITAAAAAATLRLRTVQFISLLSDFHSLQLPTRNSLIRTTHFSAGVLRSAFDFHLVPADEVVWYLETCSTPCMIHYKKLIQNVRKCQLDEPCLILLMILAACSPNIQEPTGSRVVEAVQNLYLSLLHKYVYWRYGPKKARTMYPKLLSLLADAQLAGDHVQLEKHNWLEDYEYDFYQRKIPHVNPFQQYSFALRDSDFVPAIRDPYNVLQDSSPSVDMVVRFMAAVAERQALLDMSSNTKEPSSALASADSSSADLFDLIESLEY